jgi:hypothetical protein
MAFKLAPRTRQYVTSTGEIDVADVLQLGGVTNIDLNTFVASVGDNNQTIVCVVSGNGVDWQECVVTIDDASPDTLTVNEIIQTSIAGIIGVTPIVLTGTSRVFGIIPTNFSKLFDYAFGNTDNSLAARIGGAWTALPPGADGKFLSINSGAFLWDDPPAAGAMALDDLTDVVISGVVTGHVLAFDGTNFVNAALPAIPDSLDDLSDVTLSTLTAQMHLRYNGTAWINDDVGFFRSMLIEDEDNPVGTTLAIDNYRDTQTTGFPFFALRHYFGTKGAPAAITNGTVIGAYGFYGHDGTVLGLAPTIQAEATEDWDATSHGCRLLFSIVRNGEVLAIFPLVLDEAGLKFNGAAFYNEASSPYIIGFSVPQTTPLSSSQVIGHHAAAANFTIPANFGTAFGLTSKSGGTTNATASTVFSIDRAVAASPNTFVQIGTVTIAAGTVTPTFATAGGVAISIAEDDVIRAVGPATPDATFTGFYLTLVGSRA